VKVLLDPGQTKSTHFEATLYFAKQLQDHGLHAMVPASAIPANAPRLLRYEASPWLADEGQLDLDRVIVLNCDQVSAASLSRVQSIYSEQSPALVGIGSFSAPQEKIISQGKLAYAANTEPTLLDISDYQKSPLVNDSSYILLGDALTEKNFVSERPALTLCLLDEAFDLPHFEALLGMIVHDPQIRCTILVSAARQSRILKLTGRRVRVLTLGEAQPHVLSSMSDIFCVVGKNAPGGRIAAAALQTLVDGGVVVDATENGAYCQSNAPVINSPFDMSAIISIVKNSIQSFSESTSRSIQNGNWVHENSLKPLIKDICQFSDLPGNFTKISTPIKEERADLGKILFVPTNGVGLGHAQRSSLIALEMEANSLPSFAAFPSCVPMLRRKGFPTYPLVAKSDGHRESYANDFLNYTRLDNIVGQGDHIVFDGAYIFDSILRVVREKELSATWIRRGLWQPGQVERMPLQREHDFTNVIVPDEAFDELNTAYTYGEHIHRTAPIVQRDILGTETRDDIRRQLFEHFGSRAQKILVTMLGGGVAADRELQLQTICALCEGREDILHLIVVWPQGVLSPALNGWQNSHVIRSQQAVKLAQASDLTISAVGYNSFHEIMYHSIPALLMPQMAGYMDDQARRAGAAAKRGVSIVLEDPANLMALRKNVAELLEDGATAGLKAAFRELSLPLIGNSDAARIIEESRK